MELVHRKKKAAGGESPLPGRIQVPLGCPAPFLRILVPVAPPSTAARRPMPGQAATQSERARPRAAVEGGATGDIRAWSFFEGRHARKSNKSRQVRQTIARQFIAGVAISIGRRVPLGTTESRNGYLLSSIPSDQKGMADRPQTNRHRRDRPFLKTPFR